MVNNEEYDNIPVYYCKRCLSLLIRGVDDLEYCGECGCTDIDCVPIEEWENIYYKRYGKYFTNYGREDENK